MSYVTPMLAREAYGSDRGRILDMLTYKRPAGSKSERRFVRRFIDPLEPYADNYGNRWVQVGESPNLLFTAHTDSVHRAKGTQLLDVNGDIVSSIGNDVLGADCAAGVWLLLEMIDAGVPGLYAFFRDEEIGGLGSAWAARHMSHLFDGIDAAIAFDRKGYDSVITHQGSRTASDAFARSLCAVLGMGFAPDDTGLFTDTANLTDLIGECSNISVGYHHAHSAGETQDMAFLVRLRDVLVSADWSALTFERKPGDPDDDWSARYAQWGVWEQEREGRPFAAHRDAPLVDLVCEYPDEAADLLAQLGVTEAEFRDFLGLR